MAKSRGVLYETVKGWQVREFSNSQYNQYSESPAKYKWQRIHGWKERIDRATMKFGIDLQEAVRRYYKEGQHPVECFAALWLLRKTETLDYGEKMTWEKFEIAGKGLMAAFLSKVDTFPIRKPVFLDMKDKQLPVINDPATGVSYKSIPDVIDADERGPFVCDIKAMDKLVNVETPGLIVNDSQLRTQAATTKIPRVVLWVFCRTPKSKDPLGKEVIFEFTKKILGRYAEQQAEILTSVALCVARESNALTIDDAGRFLELPDAQGLNKEWKARTKKDEALKNAPVEVLEALKPLVEPEYKIQWIEETMTMDWAMNAVHDQMSVIPQIQAEWFPCRCAMRWPRDNAPRCPFRGLCLENACAAPTDAQREAWRKITEESLVRWDAQALAGLDEEE
jgi:hypothetical protein